MEVNTYNRKNVDIYNIKQKYTSQNYTFKILQFKSCLSGSLKNFKHYVSRLDFRYFIKDPCRNDPIFWNTF